MVFVPTIYGISIISAIILLLSRQLLKEAAGCADKLIFTDQNMTYIIRTALMIPDM